jgi:hypothetical protein
MVCVTFRSPCISAVSVTFPLPYWQLPLIHWNHNLVQHNYKHQINAVQFASPVRSVQTNYACVTNDRSDWYTYCAVYCVPDEADKSRRRKLIVDKWLGLKTLSVERPQLEFPGYLIVAYLLLCVNSLHPLVPSAVANNLAASQRATDRKSNLDMSFRVLATGTDS